MTLLRAARTTDAGKGGAILSQFVDENDWMPRLHTRAEDVGFVGTMIDRGWVTIAEEEGQVLGFMSRDAADIHALYVNAAARRKGVGTALLSDAQKRHDRLELWTFQANLPAQAFYLAHGFTETRRTDGATTDEGLPDIHFHWERRS